MKKNVLYAAVIATLMTGCATQESNNTATAPATNAVANVADIPEWVLNPSSANGFAASNCVKYTGNFSVDRNHAVSLTRNALAQNMDLKANVLEKTYQKMDSASGETSTGTSFEQIAKQITSVSLQKSQIEKVKIVNIAGVPQVCSLVTIPKVESEKAFTNMVNSSGPIDPSDKAALYKEFMSQKTTAELEQQVKTLANDETTNNDLAPAKV